MIRALLQRWRSRPAAASEPVSPRMCGLRDAVLDGWFRSETGELLAGFAIGAQDTLLDLGCGEGVATLFAARQGASVIFTDSEEDKVRSLAQQVEAVARRPFTGLVSDSDPLPLRDACADKLVCMEVLEHVANPARVMDELVRLGRPGAQYLLSVPDPVANTCSRASPRPTTSGRPTTSTSFPVTTSRAWCRTPGWSSSTARPAASSG